MEKRLALHKKRNIAAENLRQNFLRSLDQAFGPPRLLRLEPIHIYWQFRRTLYMRQIQKFPAFQLRSIRKIRILGKRVVLPSTCFVNRSAPPPSCGPIKIKKRPAAETPAMLNHKMTVQQNGFHAGQQRIVTVE